VALVLCQALLLLVLAGCGKRLPKYAEPTGGSVDPESLTGRDLISYRKLDRSDFLGTHPPEDMRPYAERMGAVTCANVLTRPEPEYYIEKTDSGYVGAYTKLSFAARMDRRCSWWNDKTGVIPKEYVLQHEQIHFALAEVAAQQLNRQARKILAKKFSDKSEADLHTKLQQVVEKLMDQAIEKLLRRNLRFDQDTSNKHEPAVQQRWYDEVMQQLES
jgi:hypothetical protein